jgi:hypothetical protein
MLNAIKAAELAKAAEEQQAKYLEKQKAKEQFMKDLTQDPNKTDEDSEGDAEENIGHEEGLAIYFGATIALQVSIYVILLKLQIQRKS